MKRILQCRPPRLIFPSLLLPAVEMRKNNPTDPGYRHQVDKGCLEKLRHTYIVCHGRKDGSMTVRRAPALGRPVFERAAWFSSGEAFGASCGDCTSKCKLEEHGAPCFALLCMLRSAHVISFYAAHLVEDRSLIPSPLHAPLLHRVVAVPR